jgi:hypothetical protein
MPVSPVEFYDSSPGPFDTLPGEYPDGAAYAAAYADTSLEAGYRPQPAHGIPHLRYITRRGGSAAAAYAGICDYERGNLSYEGGNLGAWAQERIAGRHRARVYCDRSDVTGAYEQVAHLDGVEWWIATLDNNPHWTPALIVASVRAITGIQLGEDAIWGIQWGTNSRYDTSYLTSTW